jgi:hypothetical protein
MQQQAEASGSNAGSSSGIQVQEGINQLNTGS